MDLGTRANTMNRSGGGLHTFAVITSCATLVLIIAGALVTSNDAGLAAPDWPLSYGQVFPKMVGNLIYEHGHRLIAASVGLLTIALNVWLWKKEERRWVRRVGLLALGAVVAQGILGGITVLFYLPTAISVGHACLAQIFFCLMVSLVVFTSRDWQEFQPLRAESASPALRHRCAAACAAIFLQLILGAVLRHSATWDQFPPPNLLIAHIAGAAIVTVLLVWVAASIRRQQPEDRYLLKPAAFATSLLGLQLLLGVAAYLARRASPHQVQPLNPMVSITVVHVAIGALTLAATLFLTLRVFRVLPSTTIIPDIAAPAGQAAGGAA